MRSVHSDRMGWGIEPRKEEFCGGRDARNRRRQHVRHRYARCRRSAGVEGHITSERSASEPESSTKSFAIRNSRYAPPKIRFAFDSPLEGDGFELPVPRTTP